MARGKRCDAEPSAEHEEEADIRFFLLEESAHSNADVDDRADDDTGDGAASDPLKEDRHIDFAVSCRLKQHDYAAEHRAHDDREETADHRVREQEVRQRTQPVDRIDEWFFLDIHRGSSRPPLAGITIILLLGANSTGKVNQMTEQNRVRPILRDADLRPAPQDEVSFC